MFFCVLYGIVFTFLIIFICSPVVGFFHIYDPVWRAVNEVHCHNEGAIIVACAAISTIQDLIICMLPIFLIWNLKITRRQRFALCGIFGMGLITSVCGILRTYYAAYVYYCKILRSSFIWKEVLTSISQTHMISPGTHTTAGYGRSSKRNSPLFAPQHPRSKSSSSDTSRCRTLAAATPIPAAAKHPSSPLHARAAILLHLGTRCRAHGSLAAHPATLMYHLVASKSAKG